MTITVHESGLEPEAYDALAAARTTPTFNWTAYQWDLDFSAIANGAGEDDDPFDAVLFDGLPYRLVGQALEAWDGEAWVAVDGFTTPPSVSTDMGGALVVEDDTLYVFLLSGTSPARTVYRINYDGESWGEWTQLSDTSKDIRHLAAARAERVHLVVAATSDRYELMCLTDDGTFLTQDLYWPFPVESFAAAPLHESDDLVVMTTMLPAIVQTRAINTTILKKVIPTGGVVAFPFQSGEYADHVEVDVTDEWQPWRFRKYVTASRIDDTIYVLAYSRDGTKQKPFGGHRFMTTKNALDWSRAELLRFPGASASGIKILRDDEGIAYALQARKGFTAFSTLKLGLSHPSMQMDITARHLEAQLNFQGMLQVSMELDNQGDYWAGTFLNGEHTVALRLREGHYPAPNSPAILVQTALLEVDSYEYTDSALGGHTYTNVLKLTARDRLSWLTDRSQSEQFLYRDPQVSGGDDYVDATQSGYGGLGHTATWEGSWRTDNGELVLWSNNKEAQAASTFKIDFWNFDVQVSFHLSKVTNNEFAGFLFRAIDHQNAWRCYYNQSSDRILVVHRVNDEDTIIAASESTLGWADSPATVRHLRLRAYYGIIFVFISSDGITWGAPHLTVEYPGQPALPDSPEGVFPEYCQQAGYVGLIGQGYNPEEVWSFEMNFITQVLWLWEFVTTVIEIDDTGDDDDEVEAPQELDEISFITIDYDLGPILFTVPKNIGTPVSTRLIPGLPGQGGLDNAWFCNTLVPDHSQTGKVYAVSSDGLFVCENVYDITQSFTKICDWVDIVGSTIASEYDPEWIYPSGIFVDEHTPDWIMVTYGGVACVSHDGGETWTQSRINPDRTDDFSLDELVERTFTQTESGNVIRQVVLQMDGWDGIAPSISWGRNIIGSRRIYCLTAIKLRSDTGALSNPDGTYIDLCVSDDMGENWSVIYSLPHSDAGAELGSGATFGVPAEVFVPKRKLGISNTQNFAGLAQQVFIVASFFDESEDLIHRTRILRSENGGLDFTEVAVLEDPSAATVEDPWDFSMEIHGRGRSVDVSADGRLMFSYFNEDGGYDGIALVDVETGDVEGTFYEPAESSFYFLMLQSSQVNHDIVLLSRALASSENKIFFVSFDRGETHRGFGEVGVSYSTPHLLNPPEEELSEYFLVANYQGGKEEDGENGGVYVLNMDTLEWAKIYHPDPTMLYLHSVQPLYNGSNGLIMLCDDGAYICENALAEGAQFTQIASDSDMLGAIAEDVSFGVANHVAYTERGLILSAQYSYLLRSTDGGVSWSLVLFDPVATADWTDKQKAEGSAHKRHVVESIDGFGGRIYMFVQQVDNTASPVSQRRLYVSTNDGGDWTLLKSWQSLSEIVQCDVFVPERRFDGSPNTGSDQLVILIEYGYNDDGENCWKLHISEDGGSNFTEKLVPGFGEFAFGPFAQVYANKGIQKGNPNVMWLPALRDTWPVENTLSRAAITVNGGEDWVHPEESERTWTYDVFNDDKFVVHPEDPGTAVEWVYFSASDYDYFEGWFPQIRLTKDSGETWTDLSDPFEEIYNNAEGDTYKGLLRQVFFVKGGT